MLLLKSNEKLYTNSSTLPILIVNHWLVFWFFLVFDIFGVICGIFVIYELLRKRDLREALHNHVLIVLLLIVIIYDTTTMPLHLRYLSTGVLYPSSPTLCLIWQFLDWSLFYTITMLLLFGSIERHLLVFHHRLFNTMKTRVILHYLPLTMILTCMMTFYSVALFAPICESTFDYTLDLCGTFPCYSTIPFFQICEQICFGLVAPFCLVSSNSILLFRVLYQKYRIHRSVEWKKQRKITVQMIFTSTIYLIFTLPSAILYIIRSFQCYDCGNDILLSIFYYSYCPVFLIPFACLTALPQFWHIIERINSRQHKIVPQTIPLS
ncbi:unnamed protein product [Adineta ricciae]|uniref:G-protein coupled receptors family 1 profile domain-containing protein n=1 Tax=Adineta ricciae TaxID=249248 RepID=A0A814Z5F8_ADIRI|nr:unnamed protein product [Adineta ricciae]CAF1238232.1 unnamed protein product [Adineta ricciae]